MANLLVGECSVSSLSLNYNNMSVIYIYRFLNARRNGKIEETASPVMLLKVVQDTTMEDNKREHWEPGEA